MATFQFLSKKSILAQCDDAKKDEDYFKTCHELQIPNNDNDGCDAIFGYDMSIALYVY